MAVTNSLTVTEVAGSPSTATNQSKVRILWTSTQTGESWNGYTRTAYYYVSINGGAETQHSVSYSLPKGTTKTIVDTTITVTHKDDGSGTVKVRTWMDTDISAGVIEKSQTITLTTIARASSISSAAAVTLGNKCSVKWTPKAAAFRYKLKFALGEWSYTTGAIHPDTTNAYTYSGYTIPLDVANQLPNSDTGTMTVSLYTYSNSGATTQVGSADSETFTVTVPDNQNTKPKVSMDLTPVSSLPAAFAGLYIQGKTKVKASLEASGEYKASIKSYSMKVDGTTYDSGDDYTSGYQNKVGTFTVNGYAKDSRGHIGSASEDITVIAYTKPKILDVVAARCDSKGNLADNGTYLKIQAKRSYSPVKSGKVQKNFCKIRYRYKLSSAASYSAWTTILAGDSLSSDQVNTGALLGGVLSVASSYLVQVQAIDDLGEYASTTITVPTDKVYWHRDGERNSFAFGGYVEEDNTFSIAGGVEFKVKSLTGETVTVSDTGWIDLGIASTASEPDSEYDFGRNGIGCYYRVINGNHVYVAFNCACEYAGENVQLNATAIPSKYRPSRYCYSMLPVGGKSVVRAFVSPVGAIKIGWIQSLTSGADTTSASVTWVDGYIDYWV